MAKVVVINHLTLDGVMQAPGRPDEDRRGGFEHGGWSPPHGDAVMGSVMGERIAQGGGALALRLVDTKTTTTGVLIATYQPAQSTT